MKISNTNIDTLLFAVYLMLFITASAYILVNPYVGVPVAILSLIGIIIEVPRINRSINNQQETKKEEKTKNVPKIMF